MTTTHNPLSRHACLVDCPMCDRPVVLGDEADELWCDPCGIGIALAVNAPPAPVAGKPLPAAA